MLSCAFMKAPPARAKKKPSPAKNRSAKTASKGKPPNTEPVRVAGILAGLDAMYPDAVCELTHENPFQLLIATILSAQCTDVRVNQVTASLFKKYRTAKDFAAASSAELEQEIRPTGFFRNKTKSVIGASKSLVRRATTIEAAQSGTMKAVVQQIAIRTINSAMFVPARPSNDMKYAVGQPISKEAVAIMVKRR